MDTRALLEQLEERGAELRLQLAYVAVQSLALDEDELAGARRRALLLLASGGDPRRHLDLDGRAVAALADDLDLPVRRAALREALADLRSRANGLPGISAALDELVGDELLAWRSAACALLAEELAA
jgi:hypothetical protein